MKALSILQPWAWLIVRPDITDPVLRQKLELLKDIENRSWCTRMRGRVLVHAGQRYSMRQYRLDRMSFADEMDIELPPFELLERGGIIGSVEIVDCVLEHPSRWKMPLSYGFVLRDARPLVFRPLRGRLGFFEVTEFN